MLVHDPDSDPPIPSLDGVDLAANPGRLIALVGPSSAGKLTILNLVTQLYNPTEGSVWLDGVILLVVMATVVSLLNPFGPALQSSPQ